MGTKSQVLKLAKSLNAEVILDVDFSQGEILAPEGKEWYSSGCRSFCVNYGYRGGMASVYDELIEALQDGYV